MSKLTLDEAIELVRKNASDSRQEVILGDNLDLSKQAYNEVCIEFAEEQKQIAELLEKLKYIENIILRWNADWYNDEDNGIPDNEILEAIFNACTDNGFDIPIDEDYREGYNKAIDEFEQQILKYAFTCSTSLLNGTFVGIDKVEKIAEHLKAGVEND